MRHFFLLLFLEGFLCHAENSLILEMNSLFGWQGSCILILCWIKETYSTHSLNNSSVIPYFEPSYNEDHFGTMLYSDSIISQNHIHTTISSLQEEAAFTDAPKGVELIADPGTTLREGEKLSLECLVKSSNPAVLELQWWKNNHRTSGRIYGNRMEIGPLGRQHSGRYRCKARNKFGTTESKELTIDVQYPPKETKSPFRSRTIKENDTVTLECSFIAKPPITKYEWYKKPSTSAISSQKQLHFQAIRPSDSGTYYCQVYNPIGGSNSSLVMLDVHYPPEEPQISFSRSTVQGKDAVSLHCWSTARPPITHYEWYKCPAEDILSSQQELHFQAIQPNDSGGYYCKAYNPIGQSNSSVLTLNIHGADVCN